MLSNESKDFCKRQAARMSCLSKWPFEVEGQLELAKALHEAAVTEEHAADTVSWIVSNTTLCPTPRDLKVIAFEQRAGGNPSEGCQRGCEGSGFLQTRRVLPDGSVYAGVKRCGCRVATKESDRPGEPPKRTDMVKAGDMARRIAGVKE